MLSHEQIIEYLDLKPLPIEGGYFRRTYLSTDKLGSTRCLSSAIYYLLTPDTYSKLHCLPSDEIYHFYLGDPIELLLLDPSGVGKARQMGQDILGGQVQQMLVPAHTWQGSRLCPGGEFALLGTTMAPAFDESDFTRPPSLNYLLEHYESDFHDLICQLF